MSSLREGLGQLARHRVAAAALVSMMLLAVTLAFRQIDSPDIGLHLAPGRWILQHLSFPTADPFTFGAEGNRYIDPYWLYQIIVALADYTDGAIGLLGLHTLVLIGAVLVMIRRSWNRTGAASPLVIILLLWIVLTINYELRPHIFSWLYLGLLLFTWEKYYQDRTRSLLPSIAIMVAWSNTQPTFVIGWVVIASFWLGMWFQEKRFERKTAIFAGGSVLACLLNPYFHESLIIPIQQFGFLHEASTFKHLIAEYAPLPFFPGPDTYTTLGQLDFSRPMFLLQILRIVLLGGFVIQLFRKRLRAHEVLLFITLFYLNSLAQKNIGYFVLGVTPLIVTGTHRQTRSARSGVPDPPRQPHILSYFTNNARLLERLGSSFIILCSLVMTLRVVTNGYYSSLRLSYRFGFAYNNLFLPVQAAEFLKRHELEGKILNHIDFGGYFIANIPQKVYVDARNEVMGERLASEYMLSYSPEGLRSLIGQYDPQLIAFPHKGGQSWFDFVRRDSSEWRLVYFDELAAVYARRGYKMSLTAIRPDSILQLHGILRADEVDAILGRTFGGVGWGNILQPQYYPVRESEMSVFCSDNGWNALAIRLALEGIKKSTVTCPELYYNLGLYYRDLGDEGRSKYALMRSSALMDE